MMIVVVIPELSFESTRGLSQEEFALWVRGRLAWDPNHYELLNGRIIMTPPAGFPHGSVEARVVSILSSFAVAHDAGEVLGSSQGIELPSGATVAPDACLVSRERWNAMPPPELGAFLKVVPDLVVEILSLSTASHDRGEKKAIYERDGVREYWLVDPRATSVTVFVAQGGRFDLGTTYTQTDRVTSSILPDLVARVSDLFP